MMRLIKRIPAFFLCLALISCACTNYAMAAPKWPTGVSIQAESGIVMDGDTKTVLWGKNINDQHFPASITKIMTALIVLERCSLDETVTFSHNAVYNVEEGSSNAGISEGDKLSVKDCLYALLLKSANEAANALAEHVAGSTEAFAELMNQKAKELGCTNTHFANPSGLNNPEHYTCAYDMALIASAAFSNPIFQEIDSTTSYKLPPNSINPEGLVVYPGHKMLKKSTPYYYPGIIGGKTGYTTLASNTLVTCAQKNDMKLIAVILKGSTPQYWIDTKNLLDFGFNNFVSIKAADHEKKYSPVSDDLSFSGFSIDKPDALILDPDGRIVLPNAADFTDTEAILSYDVGSNDPKNAVAKISYWYQDLMVGYTYLEINDALFGKSTGSGSGQADPKSAGSGSGQADPKSAGSQGAAGVSGNSGDAENPSKGAPPETTEDYREKALQPFEIPTIAWAILMGVAVILLLAALVLFLIYRKEQAVFSSHVRREQRKQRLKGSGISTEEFDQLLAQKRNFSRHKRKAGGRKRRFRFKFK